MKMIEKYHKELIILGVIIELILVPLIVRNIISLNNKNSNDNNTPSVSEIGKQEFGIMYRDNDTDSYKAYSGSIIDAINNKYVLNVNNSKCSDGSGTTVIPSSVLSINGSMVTIKSNKTVCCTLYFDKKKTISALDIVASKPKSLSPNADQGDMYRYQGTSELVNNNYICFGTNNKATCTGDEDHYMYRIIGITPSGEMKLIKQTPVVEQGNTVFSWFKATGTNENGGTIFSYSKWPESAIYKRLNGLSNGSITGDGQNANKSTNKNINANTNIFVDSYTNEYPYMKKTSEWYTKISNHEWVYGESQDTFDYNGHEMYKAETGQIETYHSIVQLEEVTGYEKYKWTEKVTAKIGLPYAYDYYLTFYDGITEDTRGIPGNDNLKNLWIGALASNSIAEMTTAPEVFGAGSFSFACVRNFGLESEISINGMCSTVTFRGLFMFPTFYIPNTIEMEGSRSISNSKLKQLVNEDVKIEQTILRRWFYHLCFLFVNKN